MRRQQLCAQAVVADAPARPKLGRYRGRLERTISIKYINTSDYASPIFVVGDINPEQPHYQGPFTGIIAASQKLRT
jgi:hypothetical protein